MTAQLPPVRAKKPLWRRVLKWTLRAAVLLIVLGVAAYAITNYWAARTMHNEIARIRGAGEPITFADLDALWPKVDRAQDAGPYYTAAAELVDVSFLADSANEAFFRYKDPDFSPDILARAHRNIEQNRLALDLLDRGSALPGCNSDIHLQFGFEVAFPYMGKARNLLNVGSLRSRVLALDGHGDQAIESIIATLGLLRTMDRQPVLMDSLVQTAMLARCCADVSLVLEKGQPSDAAIQKLGDALLRLRLIQPRQMFMAERVFFLEITRNTISMGPGMKRDNSDERPFPNEMWSSLGLTGRVMAARSLPSYARYVDAASGEWPAVFIAIQKEAAKPATLWDSISSPSFVRAMVLYARGLSACRSTLITLQIERFRLSHAGQLPDSLKQLPNASDLPMDPFTGNALLYVKTSDGYCVFSAGRGAPEDSNVDRDKDPVAWSRRWGTHIRLQVPSTARD